MSTAETFVIQCPTCQQKYRWHVNQAGKMATCQKCQHAFVASNSDIAIPEEFDDSIPVVKKRLSQGQLDSSTANTLVRDTEMKLESERLTTPVTAPAVAEPEASELGSQELIRAMPKLLFWGGAILFFTATFQDTTVGDSHNLAKAANQLLLALAGVASMISGAAMTKKDDIYTAEPLLLLGWFVVIFMKLASPNLR